MAAYDKLLTLAERLSKRTQAGELNWEPTASSDVFQTTLGSYVVKIMFVEGNGAQSNLISVEIINDQGAIIESFDDEDLAKLMGSAKKAWDFMSDLFGMIRRRALGTEQAIDTLLDELDDG